MWNYGISEVNLKDIILHDDNGYESNEAHTFTSNDVMGPGKYLHLCQELNFTFVIDASDTISLTSPNGYVVVTTGPLNGDGSDKDITFSRTDKGAYVITSLPTPGKINEFDGNVILSIFFSKYMNFPTNGG